MIAVMSQAKHDEVVVIGFGVVGRATASVLDCLHHAYDPAAGFDASTMSQPVRTAIVCTPCADGWIDCFEELDLFGPQEILVRSTVLPEAIVQLAERFPSAWVAHWPEWLTEGSASADAANPDKVVLGVMDGDLARGDRRMRELCGQRWPVPSIVVDARASTLAKIGVNSMYATKVWLFNVLYEAAGDDRTYSELCSVIAMDQRIHLSHARPWSGGYMGFGGKCISKDLGFLGLLAGEQLDADVIEQLQFANAHRVEATKVAVPAPFEGE